jgi:hypothetical protein
LSHHERFPCASPEKPLLSSPFPSAPWGSASPAVRPTTATVPPTPPRSRQPAERPRPIRPQPTPRHPPPPPELPPEQQTGTATDEATDESGSADSQTFEKSKLEDFLSNDVQQKSGVQPDQLACKGDLAVEENATQECAVKTEAGWQKLNVTLLETDTDDPKISWQTEADIIPEPDWVGDAA